MPTFTTRVFGTRTFDKDDYWKGETTVGGHRRERSLHLHVTDQAALDRAAALVDDLERLDERARAFIHASRGGSDPTVRAFIDDQLAELDVESIVQVFGAGPETIDHATFLAKLQLITVAVRDSEDDLFELVLDYSIGPEVSDELK
jgi:hypothetical protein